MSAFAPHPLGDVQAQRMAALRGLPRRPANEFAQYCALIGVTGDLAKQLWRHWDRAAHLSPQARAALQARPRTREFLKRLQQARKQASTASRPEAPVALASRNEHQDERETDGCRTDSAMDTTDRSTSGSSEDDSSGGRGVGGSSLWGSPLGRPMGHCEMADSSLKQVLAVQLWDLRKLTRGQDMQAGLAGDENAHLDELDEDTLNAESTARAKLGNALARWVRYYPPNGTASSKLYYSGLEDLYGSSDDSDAELPLGGSGGGAASGDAQQEAAPQPPEGVHAGGAAAVRGDGGGAPAGRGGAGAAATVGPPVCNGVGAGISGGRESGSPAPETSAGPGPDPDPGGVLEPQLAVVAVVDPACVASGEEGAAAASDSVIREAGAQSGGSEAEREAQGAAAEPAGEGSAGLPACSGGGVAADGGEGVQVQAGSAAAAAASSSMTTASSRPGCGPDRGAAEDGKREGGSQGGGSAAGDRPFSGGDPPSKGGDAVPADLMSSVLRARGAGAEPRWEAGRGAGDGPTSPPPQQQQASPQGAGEEGENTARRQMWQRRQRRRERQALVEALMGTVLLDALGSLRLPRALDCHRSSGLHVLFRDLLSCVRQQCRGTGAAAMAGSECESVIERCVGRVRDGLEMSELRAVMRRHMATAMLEPQGSASREDCVRLAEHAVRWALLPRPWPQELQREEGGSCHGCGSSHGEEGAAGVEQDATGSESGGGNGSGCSQGVSSCVLALDAAAVAAGVGQGEGGAPGVRGPHVVGVCKGAAEGAGPKAGPDGSSTLDGDGCCRAAGDVSSSPPHRDRGQPAATQRGDGGDGDVPYKVQIERWLFEEVGPLFLRVARRALSAAGGDVRGRTRVQLVEVVEQVQWVALLELYEQREGDWALLTLTEGFGASAAEATAGRPGTDAAQTPGGEGAAAAAAVAAVAGAATAAGTAGAAGRRRRGGAAARAGGAARSGRTGGFRAGSGGPDRLLLARTPELCQQLARRFEYRWPVAAVGAEHLAALLRLYTAFGVRRLCDRVAMWVPLALRLPRGLQEPGREGAAADTRSQDPYRPSPGTPCCVAVQFLCDLVHSWQMPGGVNVMGMARRSFDDVYLQLRDFVLQRDFGVLACENVEEVQMAVLACAKVRELLLSNRRQDSICVAELPDAGRNSPEWAKAYELGGWPGLFGLVDNVSRSQLGRMRIVMVSVSSRRGTRQVALGSEQTQGVEAPRHRPGRGPPGRWVRVR